MANLLKRPDPVVLTVLGLAVAAVLSIALAVYISPRPKEPPQPAGPYEDAMCNALASIATDPQKVSYVRTWFTRRANDPRFMYELNENPDFTTRDPRKLSQVNLDWNYLGLNPKWAAASFNIRDSDRKPFTADRFKSITLYHGRAEITIGLSPDGDLGFDPPPAALERMRSFGDNVFVSCGDD